VKPFWSATVFLRHPTAAYASEALIELQQDGRLILQVRAPSPDLFFNVLRDSMEHLLGRRWPGLQYQFLIPCPSPGCVGEFPLNGLLRWREQGKATRDCLDCDVDHDISVLLTGFTSSQAEIRAQLEALHEELGAISGGIHRIECGVQRIEVFAARKAVARWGPGAPTTRYCRHQTRCPTRPPTGCPVSASTSREFLLAEDYLLTPGPGRGE
jgi:hypothetical protein